MELFGLIQASVLAERGKSGSGSVTELYIDIPQRRKISFHRPRLALSGEPRYLTPLWVSEHQRLPEVAPPPEPSFKGANSLMPRAENFLPHHDQEVKDKIRTALSNLTFREPCTLVQFWSSLVVGSHHLLTTADQPFGFGEINEGLFSYRRESERNQFFLDENCEQEHLNPPARVFRQRRPEWTSDITNYKPSDYPQQDCAFSCNLRGSLALPVFEPFTKLCVGVLELVTTSEHLDYAYEVQEVHRAMKAVNLTSPQAFDYPVSDLPGENRQHELDKIFSVLKVLSDTYNIPLAQTWTVSSFSSFVAHGKTVEKSCSSFNTRCIGKVCMTTAALPFHVRELGMWNFREACRERHLEKSRGVVGRALLSRASCFCGDVTKLIEDEYPLVHNACMFGLTSCFTIYLHSVESDDDYVLEFFLPLDMRDGTGLMNLVKAMKQQIDFVSGFKLGDVDSIENILSTEVNKLSPYTELLLWKPRLPSLSSEGYPVKCDSTITTNMQKEAPGDVIISNNVTSFPVINSDKLNDTFSCVGEKTNSLKQSRKRKISSLNLETVQQHFGLPIGAAAMRLGVSRSTLKRVCRELRIRSWPLPKRRKKENSKLSERSPPGQDLEGSSKESSDSLNVHFGIFGAVFLLVRVKRWRCSSNGHGFSGKWWICRQYNSSLSNSKPLRESHEARLETLAFSKSSNVCFGIYHAAFLITGLMRWRNRCISRHGILHSPEIQCVDYVTETRGSQNHITNILAPNPYLNDYFPTVGTADMHMFPWGKYFGYSGASLAEIEDARMVTVKASFKDDMIKFLFYTSSGLSELENQVAQRIKLKFTSFRLKYIDEDNDLILIACDADLQNLMSPYRNLSENSILKLIVQLVEN